MRYRRDMAKQPEYPVFDTEPKPASNAPPPSSGGGLGILGGVGIGLVAILALGFTAVKVKGCREDREHEAGEAEQRANAEKAKRCSDSWTTSGDPECAAFRKRQQRAAVDAPVTCDEAGPRKRREWLDAPTTLRGDRATPRALGFTDDGDKCVLRVVTRALDCSESAVRSILGDDPFLREAKGVGFQWLLCESTSGRTPYRLADIVK
jgi:hypothetical protein